MANEMNLISKLIHSVAYKITQYAEYEQLVNLRLKLGLYANGADLRKPDSCACPEKVFMHENTNLYAHSKLIISPVGENGKFIMLPNSGAAEGLTVITGNHHRVVGKPFKELMYARTADEDKDVIVEEDAWIGANVTLLAGVRVGRGSTIAAGSVCIKGVPPYSIVMGNPAKVIGFNYTPEEIIEHEKNLYPEDKRIPLQKLERNYQKHFLNRSEEIANILQ